MIAFNCIGAYIGSVPCQIFDLKPRLLESWRPYRRSISSMAETLLMPKATAVWLVDNTSLSFEQIAAFCKMHPLEIKAIADGDAAQGIKGLNPIMTGQLMREDIETAQKNPNIRLKLAEPKTLLPKSKRHGSRYTPVSRRQDRPNAILWLLRYHIELKDSQIMRLVGTTKPTIESIRNRSHWKSANLTPSDPVTLGLCTQIELDFEVQKGSKEQPKVVEPQSTLLSAEETTTQDALNAADKLEGADEIVTDQNNLDADSVFSKFKSLGEQDEDENEDTPIMHFMYSSPHFHGFINKL